MSHQFTKDWMSLNDRLSDTYRKGVEEFLAFARRNDQEELSTCLCPCKRCLNKIRKTFEVVEIHLKTIGINPNYRVWILHGEDSSKEPEQVHEDNRGFGMGDFVDDCYRLHEGVGGNAYGSFGEETDEPFVPERDMPKKYMEYKKLAEEKLYHSCGGNETTLSAIVELHNLKKQFRVSGACMTALLAIIKRWLPKENTLPKNYPKMKAMIKDLGMEVKCINVCENNCILCRKAYKDATECPQCHASRYKVKMGKSGEKKLKEANKVLRHFPIIPRLKRLYTIPWIAHQMTWHDRATTSNTQMRHPIDSVQWQTTKEKYPDFAKEGRNVWLAIATDGFNPRGVLSTAYSCWHVITVAYNLPPSLCMKQDFQMMSLLIPGPKAPSQDIDVFLEPLYDEFDELWQEGVSAYDINLMKTFSLKALLMWGIHDFPAYGNLSGSITHGYKACPSCGDDTPSTRLPCSKKIVYLNFRMYLKMDHPIRVGNRFGFKMLEDRPPPQRLSGSSLVRKLSHVKYIPGKNPKGPRRSRTDMNNDDNEDGIDGDKFTEAWYKRSLLFDLPYWPGHKVRHVIDVMHVEKNVSEHILYLLLADTKKTKDTKNAREDMKVMGIYNQWKVINRMTNDSSKPAYVLNKEEKKIFLQTLKDLKVPSRFSSNLSNIVSLEHLSLLVMKSHDHHVIIEYLLPVLLQHAFPRHPDLRRALHQISLFFNLLCSKIIIRQEILDAKFMVVEALCVLEKYFPPSFFDISIHLMVHLADEALACGPVHNRWMFPFERAMKECKNIPSNKRFVEGSIAKSYLVNESVKYAMEYMPTQDGDIFSRHEALLDDDDIYGAQGGPILDDKSVILSAEQFTQIRRWVLFRADDVPLLDEYYSHYRNDVEPSTRARGKSTSTEVEIQTQFIGWLYNKLLEDGATEGMLWQLVKGPLFDAKAYRKYHVNGYIFSPKSHDDTVSTQDSGVCMKAITTFQSSRKDKNPVDAEILWYGIIKQILEVDYLDFKTVIFYCDWVKIEDKNNGCKLCPDSNLVVVNLNNFRKSDHFLNEPSILATEASQVFYSKDLKNPNWWVVIHPSSRLTSQVDQLETPTSVRSILTDQPQLKCLMESVHT